MFNWPNIQSSALIPVLALLICNLSTASEQAASLPQQQTLKLIGKAKLSVLFWDIYQSSLYSSTGDYQLDNRPEQVVFNIHYLRDIEQSELIEHTEEQWRHLGLTPQDFNSYLAQLQTFWPNIEQGDNLTLLVNPSNSTFYFNSEPIGNIESANFGPMFLNIWLSPQTSRPKLRRQLLGMID